MTAVYVSLCLSVGRGGGGGGGALPPPAFPAALTPPRCALSSKAFPATTRASFAKCRMLPWPSLEGRRCRGGEGKCGSWYSKRAPSGAEIIRMLPRAQPQPLTGSDCAKPWTDRGIRISIHSRLTQSLIDLDLGAQHISLTGRPPPTPLIEPGSVCSENSHRYLNTYCFCLWHGLMIAHTSLLWLLPKAPNTARILPWITWWEAVISLFIHDFFVYISGRMHNALSAAVSPVRKYIGF